MNINEVASTAQQNLCDRCLRNPHYLILHKKTVSRLVAFLLLSSFFIFVAGYFFGKKKLADDFSQVAEHSSFSDQINFALSSLYDKELHTPKTKDLVESDENNAEILKTFDSKDQIASVENTIKPAKKWLAQLFGGTQQQVAEFADRLRKKGITIETRKRYGNTARGKKIYWYQAVTQTYDNESELNAVVARIIKLENIKVSDDAIKSIPA